MSNATVTAPVNTNASTAPKKKANRPARPAFDKPKILDPIAMQAKIRKAREAAEEAAKKAAEAQAQVDAEEAAVSDAVRIHRESVISGLIVQLGVDSIGQVLGLVSAFAKNGTLKREGGSLKDGVRQERVSLTAQDRYEAAKEIQEFAKSEKPGIMDLAKKIAARYGVGEQTIYLLRDTEKFNLATLKAKAEGKE